MNFRTDGLGFRRYKEVVGQSVTYFVYDLAASDTPGLASLIAEYDANGNLVAKYHHNGGLIAMTRGNQSYWYVLGSVRQLTDAQSQVPDAYFYDAWGNELAIQGSTINPHRYIGKYGYYLDTQNALMLLGVRYYSAGIGRFMNLDPIGDGENWYIYGLNNPPLFIDLSGTQSCIVVVYREGWKQRKICMGTEWIAGAFCREYHAGYCHTPDGQLGDAIRLYCWMTICRSQCEWKQDPNCLWWPLDCWVCSLSKVTCDRITLKDILICVPKGRACPSPSSAEGGEDTFELLGKLKEELKGLVRDIAICMAICIPICYRLGGGVRCHAICETVCHILISSDETCSNPYKRRERQ